jgi:hypothetical protein
VRRLTPEIDNAARLTLDYPMTFECIGDELGLFDGWALRDLARFRKRCRDGIVSCLETFLHCRDGPTMTWDGCPQPKPKEPLPVVRRRGRKPASSSRSHMTFISENSRAVLRDPSSSSEILKAMLDSPPVLHQRYKLYFLLKTVHHGRGVMLGTITE